MEQNFALETERLILRLKQFQEANMGRFLAIEKISGEKVGWCGLAPMKDREGIDLGYRFIRSRWG